MLWIVVVFLVIVLLINKFCVTCQEKPIEVLLENQNGVILFQDDLSIYRAKNAKCKCGQRLVKAPFAIYRELPHKIPDDLLMCCINHTFCLESYDFSKLTIGQQK